MQNVLSAAASSRDSRDEWENIDKEIAANPEEFWRVAGILPGFAITGSEKKSDTEIDLKVEMLPGQTDTIHAHKVGAEWKLRP